MNHGRSLDIGGQEEDEEDEEDEDYTKARKSDPEATPHPPSALPAVRIGLLHHSYLAITSHGNAM